MKTNTKSKDGFCLNEQDTIHYKYVNRTPNVVIMSGCNEVIPMFGLRLNIRDHF